MFIYPGGKGVGEEDPEKAVQVSRGEVVMLVEYFKTQIQIQICQQYNLNCYHTIITLEVDLPGLRILRNSNLLEATCRFPTGDFISFFLSMSYFSKVGEESQVFAREYLFCQFQWDIRFQQVIWQLLVQSE